MWGEPGIFFSREHDTIGEGSEFSKQKDEILHVVQPTQLMLAVQNIHPQVAIYACSQLLGLCVVLTY